MDLNTHARKKNNAHACIFVWLLSANLTTGKLSSVSLFLVQLLTVTVSSPSIVVDIVELVLTGVAANLYFREYVPVGIESLRFHSESITTGAF